MSIWQDTQCAVFCLREKEKKLEIVMLLYILYASAHRASTTTTTTNITSSLTGNSKEAIHLIIMANLTHQAQHYTTLAILSQQPLATDRNDKNQPPQQQIMHDDPLGNAPCTSPPGNVAAASILEPTTPSSSSPFDFSLGSPVSPIRSSVSSSLFWELRFSGYSPVQGKKENERGHQ